MSWGFLLGIWTIICVIYFERKTYHNILTMIGKEGGREYINGHFYSIHQEDLWEVKAQRKWPATTFRKDK